MELARLKTFLTVVSAGTLSAAAKELKASQPNIGRQMTALSKEIGIELFIRHSRGLELTQQGKEFWQLCQNIVGQLEQGTAVIREHKSEASGTLRFITGIGTIDSIMNNLLRFHKKYPDLHIHFEPISNVLKCQQFQTGDIDAGLIPIFFNDASLIQHHLFDMLLKPYASPQYLSDKSRPNKLNDLKKHKLITYTGDNQDLFNMHLIDANTGSYFSSPIYTVSNGLFMRNALINGLGIGCYGYDYDLISKGLLVDVFPSIDDNRIPYYFTYHRRLEGSPKIKAFHEFLQDMVMVWQRTEG
jgi:DNA-binding transcriptional LysR family regulator